jgi:hypothetical protein
MLDEDERHARIAVGGQAGEEGLEGSETSGRSAEADNGKGR